MIHIRIEKEEGRIKRIFANGHSLYAPKGKDIVCAGVSAILQTAIIGLHTLLPKGMVLKKQTDGTLEVRIEELNGEDRVKASAILRTMVLGLRCIEEDYPDYVKVEEVEV